MEKAQNSSSQSTQNSQSRGGKRRIELNPGEEVVLSASGGRELTLKNSDDGLSVWSDSFRIDGKQYNNQTIQF